MNWIKSLIEVLINKLLVLLSKNYWQYAFSLKKTIASLLGAFGSLYVLVEISTFYSPNSVPWLHHHSWLFLVGGFLLAAYENWPRHVICQDLAGKDVTLEVRVGDIFKQSGAIIISSNTTFDTDISSDLISPNSVQGQFTKNFYDKVQHLDTDIAQQLQSVSSSNVQIKKRGKQKLYPVGTVIKVTPKQRTFYLVALATMNQDGTARGKFADVQNALAALWEFVTTRGTLEDLVMPVIGTGFSRIPKTREDVIKEIIQSFVAGCANKKFCSKLTIMIPVKDFYQHKINLGELQDYLNFVCKYTQTASSSDDGTGTPIP